MIDHFTWLAPFYEKVIPPPDSEDILPFLQPIEKGGRLLEAGGGTARVSGQLAAYFDEIIIADLNRSMLGQAKGKSEVQPVCSHVEALPFPDGYFNSVLIVDALHHFCDQRRSIGESLRVLKSGGRLIIGEPDVTKILVKAVALFEKIALMRSRFLSPETIKQMIASFGYEAAISRDDSYSAWIAATK